MAEIVKQVRRPHDCHAELAAYGRIPSDEYWLGTIVKCSCGQHYRVAEQQMDGGYWEPLRLMPPEAES